MNKNRIEGGAERGERAKDREASMTKAQRRKSGGRAAKDSVHTGGALASRSKERRRKAEREVSEVVVVAEESDEGPNGRESETTVGLEGKGPQMSRQLELTLTGRGEAPRGKRSEELPAATRGDERSGASDLMERVVSRPNLQAALKRVRKNKGSPGIDGMTVDELPHYLRTYWPMLRDQMLAGSYQPSLVKEQQIPKSGGGMRKLGILTVLDRFIQQALLQVLQPMFDPGFSEHSHGLRPRRRAHDAVREAQRYIQAGRKWVVDVDGVAGDPRDCLGPLCRLRPASP